MKADTEKRIPVVIQTRLILSGAQKGELKEVTIWCKYLEDVIKHRQTGIIINNSHCYKVIHAKLEIRYGLSISNTYEEEGAH